MFCLPACLLALSVHATQGTLHFDFSGGAPPGEDPIVITDVRVLNILFNLSLVTKQEKPRYLMYIAELQQVCSLRLDLFYMPLLVELLV